MPTTNPRVNITFEPSTATYLTKLAALEHKSVAGLAKELIIEALELREDMVLSKIARIRDTNNMKLVDHENAWK
jgi:hypothetical protein